MNNFITNSLYRKWFLVIGIILMLFSITLVFHSTGKFIWLGGWDIIPIQNGVIHQSCQTIKGNCYYVDVNAIFDKKSISSSFSQMYEDGKSIGPANAQITNIASKGSGRFLFHNGDLYFSTSDNSSPHINNRRYELVIPRLYISQRVVSIVWVFTAAMLLLYIASLVKDYYERYKTSKKSTKSFLPTQKVLVCMFLSVSISVSCAIHFLNFWQFGLATQILILFALCELLSIVIYNILFHFILPHIVNFSQRARWIWIISSFVIAVFLMTVIPVQIPYPNDADLPTNIYQNDMNSVSFELIPIILGKIQVSSLQIDVSLNLFILLSISLILLGIDIITLSLSTFIFVITFNTFAN